jgi:hypothetical protein
VRTRRSILVGAILLAAAAPGGCFLVESFDYPLDASAPDTSLRETSSPDASDAAIDVPTNPCDADLGSDPNNCGRCGRSCLGGGCQASICQPFPIFTSIRTLSAIAANDYAVAFAEHVSDGGVYVIPRGSDAAVLVATDQPTPRDVALTADASAVYWTTSLGVRACPVTASCTPVIIGPSEETNGIAIVNETVYWAAIGAGTVSSVPVSGGDASVLQTGLSRPVGVQAAKDLFWTELGDGGPGAGSIGRVDLDAGLDAPVIRILGQTEPERLAFFAEGVYWTNNGYSGGGGALEWCPLTMFGTLCADATPCMPAGGHPLGLVIDQSSGDIYYANNQTLGAIFVTKTSPDGACVPGPSFVPSNYGPGGLANPAYLAQDTQSLYWTEQGNSSHPAAVMRIAK